MYVYKQKRKKVTKNVNTKEDFFNIRYLALGLVPVSALVQICRHYFGSSLNVDFSR
jgi:hypothetical protein